MRRLISTVLPMLIVVFFAGSLMAAPRLSIPEETFNFGFVPQHSKIAHEFWLHSVGDDTLRILRVKPG